MCHSDRMAHRGKATFALLAALGSFALAGCTSSVAQCVDWVVFETPADAAADSDAVVLGTVAGSEGSTELYGQEVAVWTIEVSEWVQGGAGDRSIDVVSVPRTCERGAPYPDGDPLAGASELLLFLRADGERWQTITPTQGVLPAPVDGEVPAVWP